MKEIRMLDFPGGPEVKTPHFPCKEAGFNLLIKDLRSHIMCGMAKKKKKKIRMLFKAYYFMNV